MCVLFTGMEWFPECRDGGLDRYLYEEIQALSSAGVTGTALFSFSPSSAMASMTIRPMAVKGAALWRRLNGARGGARQAFAEGAELVNSHFALYAFAYVWDIPAHVPLVVNFQGPWAEEMRLQRPGLRGRFVGLVAKQIEQAVYRRATRVITLSEAFRQLLHRDYGVPLARITAIPGALHLERYLAAPERREARRQLGWPADRPIILAVRRLAKRMGLHVLIDAMSKVVKEFPEVLLLMGGKGPEADSLQAAVISRRLERNVRLLGFIAEDDLPACYAAADVSVMPTVALEGFGLSTAESLACGTPVLGTPVGATPEILLPLDPNCVFDQATPEAMANRIKAVLRGDICLPGAETCQAYVHRYGWPAVVPKILEVFEEALQEKREKPGSKF